MMTGNVRTVYTHSNTVSTTFTLVTNNVYGGETKIEGWNGGHRFASLTVTRERPLRVELVRTVTLMTSFTNNGVFCIKH